MAEMADDDLEYHIKFPSTTPKESSPNGENDEFVFVYDEEKLPVVILFGWAGCQDKYLAKYSSIYEDRGCITLRCTAPVGATFFRHDKLPKLAGRFLDLLHDMSLDEHPIIFHIFSNGGAFFYQHVSLEMQRQNKMLQVKGVIFDSAPGYRRFYSVYRALGAVIGGPAWYNVPVSLLAAFILFVFFIIWAYVKALIELKMPQTEPIILGEEPYNWPQLFIYSMDDELVRCEDVDKFSGQRKEKGIKVTKLCLEKSPHVQHLITHREIYINTVVNFIQDCLNENNKMEK